MPRILYIGAPEASAASFSDMARAALPGLDLVAVDGKEAAMAHAADCEAMIGHHFQFDDALVARAPRLRWIQSLTTGTDHILTLRSLAPEVIVTSTRGMHGPQMSKLIFLHMLALARDFPRMQRNQAAAVWQRWPQPLLWGKTAVIVGVGAIAEALAPRCKAFGMAVHGVSGTPRAVQGFDQVHARRDIAAAAALADFLLVIVPLSAQTENLIDAHVLAAMKPGAYIVNAARGGVLDETVLLASLRAGRIAGAGLDVFRQQPLPADSPWWHEPKVIVTPLVGGMSDIYLQQAFPIVEANLRHFIAGRSDAMHNIVDRGAA
ncbi:MAG: D-2-hydroxyacid dehydrogenase [Burkholderiales bacterium]|nr:D-2-hydroxyacid dehydrogenase [Burkholderiales bacterium]